MTPTDITERNHLENEVMDLKADMSGVKSSIGSMQNTLAVLGESHRTLANQLATGLSSIHETIRDSRQQELNRPSVIKISTLISVATVALSAFGVAAVLVSMRLSPMEARIIANGTGVDAVKEAIVNLPLLSERVSENKRDIISTFERANHESSIRNSEQQMQINRLNNDVESIQSNNVQSIRERAETKARAEEAMRICREIHAKLP